MGGAVGETGVVAQVWLTIHARVLSSDPSQGRRAHGLKSTLLPAGSTGSESPQGPSIPPEPPSGAPPHRAMVGAPWASFVKHRAQHSTQGSPPSGDPPPHRAPTPERCPGCVSC